MKTLPGVLTATAFVAGILANAPLMAQTIGMVANNGTHSVTVFDADTLAVLGSVTLTAGSSTVNGVPVTTGDCTITEDNARAFVTDVTSRVHVIDLTTSPPILASAPNPIPMANSGFDAAISPDEKYLVVAGTGLQPLSVIDIASQTQLGPVSVAGAGNGHNSVDVCSDGSILATSSQTQAVHRATIDGTGAVTATAEFLTGTFQQRNAHCAPNAKSGVVVSTNDIRSFTIPGLALADTRAVGGTHLSAAFNPAGDRLYVRTTSQIAAFSFNSATGALGAAPVFTISVTSINSIPGMDQIAVHPDGGKLYVGSTVGAVHQLLVFDAATGLPILPVGSIALPVNSLPTGVCFGRAPAPAVAQGLDSFLLYKLADSEVDSEKDDDVEEDAARKVVVALHDQFDGATQTRRYAVKETMRLGNPVNVNDEGIGNEVDHLVGYKIHRVKGTPRNPNFTMVKVTNRFGELSLDTKQPNRLMVPSAMSRTNASVPAPANSLIDHFKCYRAGVTPLTQSQPAVTVSLVDEFNQPRNYNVLGVVRLCNPVDVNGAGIGNATGHLVCYDIERARGQAKTANVAPVYTNNAFGPLTLGTHGDKELCVPSEKDMTYAQVVPEPVKPPKKSKK